MPGSGRTGLVATIVGCSPNLAQRRAPSALRYGTARPGSANRVEPGRLFETRAFETRTLGTRTGPMLSPFLLATSPQPSRPRTRLWRTRTVLSRSGPEINT